MPIQHWTPDTTSQSAWLGGQALAQGISGGVKSLSDSIGAALEKRKTEANLADSLRKKLTILNPERKDEFRAMGLPDLTGEDMAHAESVLGEKRKMEQQEWQQRMEAQRSGQVDQSKRRMQEEAFNAAVAGRMQLNPQSPEHGDYFENPENYEKTGKPTQRMLPPEEFMGLSAQFGQLLNPQNDNLMNSLARGQAKAEFDPTQALPVRGTSGHSVVQTSSGQFQVIPPDKADEEKEPLITLAQGEPDLLGRYPNSVRVTPSQYKKHKAALDEVFKRVPSAAPASAAATGERVTVEKDGKKFTLPKAQVDAAKKAGYKLVN